MLYANLDENNAYIDVESGLVSNICDKADTCIESLLLQYAQSGEPIQVDFRKMIDWIRYGERASHMIHLYPAKLLPHIPVLFASNNVFSSKGDVVFDPFSGSGTTMLEAMLAGRVAIGADSNPLARLISRVKTTPLRTNKLSSSFSRLHQRILDSMPTEDCPDVINIDHWFLPHIKKQLNHIKQCIERTRDPELLNFFKVAFSNTVKRVSLADPKVSVPVRLKKERYIEGSKHYIQAERQLDKLNSISVYEVFYQLVESNIRRISSLNKMIGFDVEKPKIYQDARHLLLNGEMQEDESVQLIITSPPYAGAQKYIRSSSLNLGWLDMCQSNELRKHERLNIGREHYSKSEYKILPSTGIDDADKLLEEIYKINPLRAYISANYLNEMKDAIRESYRILKYGGYFVLIIANNQVCGKDFITQEYLKSLLEKYGLTMQLCLIDDIHSRGLMTKRNKAANVITCEWIMVFRKERKCLS